MIPFEKMEYTRPDVDGYCAAVKALQARLESAWTLEEAEEAFFERQALGRGIATQFTLCHIRHDIDTRDPFYGAENDFADANEPRVQEAEIDFLRALMRSPFRDGFAEKYGRILFVNAELADRTMSPAILEDLEKENRLGTEYTKLLAGARISFEGGEYTLSQMTPFKQDPDPERRLAAWRAEGGFYAEHGAELDRIYDELTRLRDGMGRKLGYDGYQTLGYARMQRNCYGRPEVERFRTAVREYVVPLADRLYRAQAERMRVPYPLSFADAAVQFPDGNARPEGTPDDILAAGRLFYHELSPETAEFIDVMLDNRLMDVLSRPGKAGGGYCTGIPSYRVPFIFANFNGTSHDVEVMTHEAGHAFAAWINRDQPVDSMVWPSMEACEVHSMSMEFFAHPWAEHFFGAQADKFRYSHLGDAIRFIPYGTLVDHFQQEVSDRPEMSPAERHAVWKRLLGVYMPWLRLDGEIPFYAEGRGWQRQHHIYTSPYYYIDYCLAQTMSLQFRELICEDRAGAWETYMRYTRQGGTRVFTELVENAGLRSPFDPETLRSACASAAAELGL